MKTDISIYVASVVGGDSNPNSTYLVTQAREEYKESRGIEKATANPETVALRPPLILFLSYKPSCHQGFFFLFAAGEGFLRPRKKMITQLL